MVEAVRDLSKEARAVEKYLRIAPRKVRLVINTIRTKPVSQAFNILTALNKKAARLVEKGLKSAVANAKVKGLQESNLTVSEIRADGGPVMKRYLSRAMGRADQILKRMTHLTVVVREGEAIPKPVTGPEKAKAPEKAKKPERREKPKKKLFSAARSKKPRKKMAAAKG